MVRNFGFNVMGVRLVYIIEFVLEFWKFFMGKYLGIGLYFLKMIWNFVLR